MNIRFTIAGFLAAAPLLSGSAFAFAPEFTGDLPTVIITDRLEAPSSDFDLAQPGPATSGIIRFSGAINLYDYINDGTASSAEKATVRWAFTETKVGGSSEESAANGTLLINNEASVSTPPTAGDLSSAALLGLNGSLSFWNKDFSGTDTSLSTPPGTPFDYLSDITTPVHDLVASGPQERIVTIYVRGDEATVDLKSFSVITKIGEGDSISAAATGPATGPVDPFVSVVPSTNDFAGWNQFSLGYFAIFNSNILNFTSLNDVNAVYQGGAITAADPSTIGILGSPLTTGGHTYAPAATPSPSGTTSLSATVSGTFSSNPKIGISSWLRTYAVSVDGNTLYRLRARLARTNNNLRDEYRIRFGSESVTGQGILLYQRSLDNTAAYLTTTAADHYAYLVAKTPAGASDIQVVLDTYSLGQLGNAGTNSALAGSGLVMSQIEIEKAARTALTGDAVLFDRGGAFPTMAAGELSATDLGVSAATAAGGVFQIAATAGGAPKTVDPTGASTTNQPRSAAVVSGKVNLTVGVPVGTFPQNVTYGGFGAGGSNLATQALGWAWSSIVSFRGWDTGLNAVTNTASNTSTGLFPMTAGKVYIADVVLSSTGVTGTSKHPTMRLRLQNNRQESQQVFELGTTNAASGVRIASTGKIYSVATSPNSLAGPAALQGVLFVDFYGSQQNSNNAPITASTVITIHRVIVSEYDGFLN